jgi:cyclic pyranopterin phosphate synthase
MVKAVERGALIDAIRLVEKKGGKSGHYRAGSRGPAERHRGDR